MKTITLTDDQFDTLFEFVDQKVESVVDASVDYNDSEILNEWEDLFDVHSIRGIKLMEKITFNNEQLEFLKFIVQDFEYNDDHERYMIEQIENKIYQAQENQALKLLTGLN